MANSKDLCFDKGNGLLPVIAQDHETGEVLMLAYMTYLTYTNINSHKLAMSPMSFCLHAL
jgi:phosphoribosyl-AMP cyclohydrolase